MTSARVHSAAAGLVLFAAAAITAVSFIAVTGAALRLSGGVMAPPIFVAALGLEAAKIGLPVEAFKLLRRREILPARIVAAAWAAAFAVCALATFAFFSAPHAVRAGRSPELARKIAALKVMERARDSSELDYEDYRGYEKRVARLRAQIAEMRTRPPKTVVRGGGVAGQLLGVIGVVAEFVSAGGLLFLRWGALRDGERITPEPLTLRTIEPVPEPEPVTLLAPGPAFTPAIAPPDPAREAAWLWPGVAPAGAMTLLTGQPKIGKSQIAIYIAAVTSSGGTWPGGGAAEPGNVILMEIEDSHGDTRARLTAAGADLERVAIRDREQGPLDLSTAEGMAVLRDQARKMGGVKLAVLSPLLAFFGRAGATDDATVRARLAPLLQWAARERAAVLGLLHPAKNAGRALEAQFAGADAYRRAARSAFVAMIDASDPEPVEKRRRRVLVCAGVNGASDDFRLFYRIEGVETGGRSTSRVVWLPDIQAEEDGGAAGMEDDGDMRALPQTAGDDAAESNGRGSLDALILALLADGPQPRKAVAAAARAAGWRSTASLYAAFKRLGLASSDKSEFGGSTMWSLPIVQSSASPDEP